MQRINRRSALLGGIVASVLPVVAPQATEAAPVAPPSEPSPPGPAELHPSDPLPESWQGWRDNPCGDTIGELIGTMMTDLSVHTDWPRLHEEVIRSENVILGQMSADGLRRWLFETICSLNTARNKQELAVTEQAVLLGYSLGMTHTAAVRGPEAWHQAALRYAGIVELAPAEEEAAYDRLNAVIDENTELLRFLLRRKEETVG